MQEHKHEVSDPGHTHSYDDKYTSNQLNADGGPDFEIWSFLKFEIAHTSTTGKTFTGIKAEGVSSGYNSGSETTHERYCFFRLSRYFHDILI